MIKFIRKLVKSCSGATAIEYGLIAALIAVVTIAGLTTLGSNLNAKYNTIATDVSAAGRFWHNSSSEWASRKAPAWR